MDLTNYSSKLVGSDDERAVSPVIGVILMVAITVILAAVIAAFVLDLGGSVGEEAQAGVSMEVDEEAEEVQIEVTSLGNSDHVNLTSSEWSATGGPGNQSVLKVGDTRTYGTASLDSSGTMSAVAVINSSDTETQVSSVDWDFS